MENLGRVLVSALRAEAITLDALAAELASRMSSDFIRIGKVMDAMTDDLQRWRLLTNPNTGEPYTSQEAWVSVRFRSQRATAFEARRIYRELHRERLPGTPLMEAAEPGSTEDTGTTTGISPTERSNTEDGG